jgi:hypothetical protein
MIYMDKIVLKSLEVPTTEPAQLLSVFVNIINTETNPAQDEFTRINTALMIALERYPKLFSVLNDKVYDSGLTQLLDGIGLQIVGDNSICDYIRKVINSGEITLPEWELVDPHTLSPIKLN